MNFLLPVFLCVLITWPFAVRADINSSQSPAAITLAYPSFELEVTVLDMSSLERLSYAYGNMASDGKVLSLSEAYERMTHSQSAMCFQTAINELKLHDNYKMSGAFASDEDDTWGNFDGRLPVPANTRTLRLFLERDGHLAIMTCYKHGSIISLADVRSALAGILDIKVFQRTEVFPR